MNDRVFYLNVPDLFDSETNSETLYPVVIMIHSFGDSAHGSAVATGLLEDATNSGFITVFAEA